MSAPANSATPAALNSIVINLVNDALNNPANTHDDVLAAFNNIKAQLAQELVANLPTIESKAAALAAMVEQKVEASCVGCWANCHPK